MDKQKITPEGGSCQIDKHGHNCSFHSKNSSLVLRFKKMGLHFCRNQTREVSALTANLVTKKFALKYSSKPHFIPQTPCHQ